MLNTIEVVLYSFVALALPLAFWSLVKGSPEPKNTPVTKYYEAEPWLGALGNLYLLSLSVLALGKLGLHFGLIDKGLADTVEVVTDVPFFGLGLSFLGLWAKALLKVRRGA